MMAEVKRERETGRRDTCSILKVHTSRFGEIEVDQDRIITMTSPVLGFPESHRFVLRPHNAGSAFMWLQSLDNPNLAFVVVPAGLIDKGFKPSLPEPDRQELELPPSQVAEYLVILTFNRADTLSITANLLGPVVLNTEKRLAKQVLLDPGRYDIAFRVE